MTRQEALAYTIRVAKSFGYTDKMLASFLHEIDERLNMMEDTSKENVDEMIADLF